MEEIECENHFSTTTTRDNDGRFIVKLPTKNKEILIGDTRKIALKRFFNIKRKLNKSLELKLEYNKFMSEYLDLNHMQVISDTTVIPKNKHAYLPHHAVIKDSSTTTRLRVVFDASVVSDNGRSLNDNLMAGPVIQDDLFTILTRFRTFEVVLNADITKMYRQIRMHPEDSFYQLIFWRNNSDEILNTYRLTTLTYGTKPASFIATRCLQELAHQNKSKYPVASSVIMNDFYMDDLLTGADNVEDLMNIKNDLVTILNQGKFQLRKFQSNVPSLVTENLENVALNKSELTKILGLLWNPANDIFKFDIHLDKIPPKITKRTILSTTAQIFDPLGLLGPIIMRAKIILQKLWSIKLNWDESVPADIHTLWSVFLEEISNLETLSIPRKILAYHPNVFVEIHGFCDASQLGYGAAIYIRVKQNNHYESRLLCSRSRVAPLKSITLPRLELCGALLLARLVNKIRQIIKLDIKREILWTDSAIVLAWIKSPSNTLKTFVANRTSEIQSLTALSDWRHIKSEDNAADVLSRGASPNEFLKNNIWFSGPTFFKTDEQNWPKSKINFNDSKIPETRVTLLTTNSENKLAPILDKYSDFCKLQRIFSYILRFISNCKTHEKKNRLTGNLTWNEVKQGTLVIIKLVQEVNFTAELHDLRKNKPLNKGSKLLSLNPFLDDAGVIRVGGRLRNAQITHDVKYPVLLPKNHFVTKLIIRHVHANHLHAGPQATLAALRQRYWILSGRSLVKQVLHCCIKCFRTNPKTAQPKMGDLPASRISQSIRPFVITGVDYAGPMFIKESRGRGKRLLKSYIALFVCFATKCVHIELVPDLSTAEFLGALKRFIGRRGLPTDIHSDNGTNFIGANNELKELIAFFKRDEFKNTVQNELTKLGIRWHFIPPKSPHMGGLWEINVKAVKGHLKRTVGNANLTFSEMCTFLVKVEACLNSRPLTPLSHDPSDLQTLTPGHFLIGQPLTELPEYDMEGVPENRLSRWQLVERIRAHFWKRWSREYLTNLQARTKWNAETTPIDPIEVGAMVVLVEDNLPPLHWKCGRIIQVHPGSDGKIRVVTVRTSSGTVKRAVRKVCVLPMPKQ